MSKYEFTVKETIEHYEQKGVTEVVFCIGNPLTGKISYELKGIDPVPLHDIEIGRYQINVMENKAGQNVLVIVLVSAQVKDVCPDYKKYYHRSEYMSGNVKRNVMFDGTVTSEKHAPVGYCHYSGHPGNVSKNMMDQHSCLCKNGKPCPHFEKYKAHHYWVNKELIKERKKQKKSLY